MEQEYNIIKDFLTQMANQDNRSTALPYFYVIKTKRSYAVGRDTSSLYNNYCPEDYDDIEFFNDDYEGIDNEEYEKLSEKERNKVYIKYYYAEEGMFLTEEDAINHLNCNHYHYSKDAYTYVKHAWRAPDLTNFLKALFKYFEIKGDK